jgi:hypothetical protein
MCEPDEDDPADFSALGLEQQEGNICTNDIKAFA